MHTSRTGVRAGRFPVPDRARRAARALAAVLALGTALVGAPRAGTPPGTAGAPTGTSTASAPVRPAALPRRVRADGTVPPDIVVLMTDDLDMSVWQNLLDRGLLPRMQAELVDRGTTFDEMFTALSMCCPSRSTFLTGQTPHNHGVLANGGKHGGFTAFKNDASTLATWMHAAGYRTGLLGKYLNGYGTTAQDGYGTYVPPGWDTWRVLGSAAQFDYRMSVQGVVVKYGHQPSDNQTDVLSGQAVAFLSSDDPRPVFLTITPTAPHYEGSETSDETGKTVRPAPRYADTPVLATIPPEALASYNEVDMSDKPVWMQSLPPLDPVAQRAGYNSKVAAMRAVDDLLGAVVDQLKASGRYEHAVIVFTSDNGFQYGTHRRMQKTDLYEESIRVPLVIHQPGQTAPQRVADWVMNTDWAPTIVELAGATPDRVMDGLSLVPWLSTGGHGPSRRSLLVEHPSDGTFSTDHPPYAMVRSHDPAITGDLTGRTAFVYAETYGKSGRLTDKEFYDLSVDPLEMQNLAGSALPKRQKQMRLLATQLQALKTCAGDGCRVL